MRNNEKTARRLKLKINESDKKIKEFILKNEEGTDARISADRINHIRDLLVERLEQIDFKMYVSCYDSNKHLAEQKEKNHQMLELLGIIKNEKNNLQKLLEEIKERIHEVQLKIGEEAADI